MYKNVVKKITFRIRYVLDQCKTQQMCDKAIVRNGERLEPVPDSYKNQQMCDKPVSNYLYELEFFA